MSDYPFSVRDVYISDPFILADPVTQKYYTYACHFDKKMFAEGDRWEPGSFYALESPDLVNWSHARQVFHAAPDFWGPKDLWAPECHIWKGKYYLISSFRGEGTYRGCQALVADSPLGPFEPVRNAPATPKGWQCLDGTLYIDRQGKPWMVFCHEWTQVQDGQVCVVPLSDDLGEAIGAPMVLFRASEAPWRDPRLGYKPEKGMTWISGFITDGCFPYRTKTGRLLMLWSNFSEHGYAVGFARSKSDEIWGPWEQNPVPLYVMDGGHSSLFRKFDGQLMMAFHAPNHPNERKRMLLFEVEDRGDSIALLNECTGNWMNIDKAKEPSGYYIQDPTVPPAFTQYANSMDFFAIADPFKEEEKE